MRILLVGGFGFIGKHLIKYLNDVNDLIVLDEKSEKQDAARFQWPKYPIVEIGNVTDGSRVKEVVLKYRPEVVIHLAALTGIKRCNDDPSLAFLVNVTGTLNVVTSCIECGCKLVFVSSREVYGDTTSDSTREDDPLVPNNIYGVTKMLAEKLVTWAGTRYNLDFTILRLTNVYGPGGDQYNVQAIVRKALTEGRIEILGGKQTMDLVYVKDVAEVVRRCLVDQRASRQIFNVGSASSMSVEEIVREIVSCLGVPVKLDRRPMRMGETLSFRPSLKKLETTLGYRPSTTFRMGLQKTIEWYKKT